MTIQQQRNVRFQKLHRLLQRREISHLKTDVTYDLIDSYVSGSGAKVTKVTFKVDFTYFDMTTGEQVVEIVNPNRDESYVLKRKLFEKRYYPLYIREVK